METRKTHKQLDNTLNIPDKFICPLTKKPMTDPVIIANSNESYSYERKAILKYFNECASEHYARVLDHEMNHENTWNRKHSNEDFVILSPVTGKEIYRDKASGEEHTYPDLTSNAELKGRLSEYLLLQPLIANLNIKLAQMESNNKELSDNNMRLTQALQSQESPTLIEQLNKKLAQLESENKELSSRSIQLTKALESQELPILIEKLSKKVEQLECDKQELSDCNIQLIDSNTRLTKALQAQESPSVVSLMKKITDSPLTIRSSGSYKKPATSDDPDENNEINCRP